MKRTKHKIPLYEDWKNLYMVLVPDPNYDFESTEVIGVVGNREEAREVVQGGGWDCGFSIKKIKTKTDYEQALYSFFSSEEIENGE